MLSVDTIPVCARTVYTDFGLKVLHEYSISLEFRLAVVTVSICVRYLQIRIDTEIDGGGNAVFRWQFLERRKWVILFFIGSAFYKEGELPLHLGND